MKIVKLSDIKSKKHSSLSKLKKKQPIKASTALNNLFENQSIFKDSNNEIIYQK